jgi:hypothetical protein
MKVEKIIIIAALIVGLGFLMTYGLNISLEKDGFVNPVTETTAPTRASDCRCLPGYIPSNKGAMPYEGVIKYYDYGKGLDMYYINESAKEYYLIQWQAGSDYFGLPAIYNNETKKIYEPITKEYQQNIKGFTYKGGLTKDKLIPKITSAYFCQSLADPTQTRSCY